MIIVTRNDIKNGLQMSQMGHSIAQYMLDYPDLARKWNNNYLISLSVNSESKLESLLTKLCNMGVPVSYFTEPDINDELTSICFLETEHTKRITHQLKLSLNEEVDNRFV